jgi:pilus assembly protein CpaE
MNNLRIAILSPDKQHLDEIQSALRSTAGNIQITAIGVPLQRAGEMAQQMLADILIVECKGEGSNELASLENLVEARPGMAIVAICHHQTPEFLLQAMRLGVREVLSYPLDTLALQAAIERIHGRTGKRGTHAKLIAFASCKGGSGGSFLASNLAYTLASRGEANVALIDLNLQFGDTHMFLSEEEAPHTLSDVVRGIHRLDGGLLKASMLHPFPRLSVLAAPNDPSHGLEARPEHVESLLAIARKHFDYVVLDMGRNVDAASVRALDQADLIYGVLQANLPSVRGARRMLEVFRSLDYAEKKVELVVNRYEKSSDLRLKDIEDVLGKSITRAIPNDYAAVAACMNQGMPIEQLAANSPVTAALLQWSGHLQGKPAQEDDRRIARIFKRALQALPAMPRGLANA